VVLLALALAACGASAAPEEEAPVIPRFTVRGRWPDPSALSYHVDPSLAPLEAELFAQTIERALAVWSATGVVGFVRAAAPVDGAPSDLVFAFARPAGADHPDSPFGRDTSVAATGPVGPGCTVWFDAGRTWQEGGDAARARGASLFQAAVHEIGHALGLAHSVDPRSVLHPQRENGRTELAPSDLDGLHSLYGGGVDAPGDLVIEGRDVPVLRRVVDPAAADWTLFDVDGDGDQELLVFARAGNLAGALTTYHFAAGPRLERSVGPFLGLAGPGARIEPVAKGGRRFLDVFQADGTAQRWSLDEAGSPRAPAPIAWRAGDPSSPATRSGDLDGDVTPERVTARR